MRYAMFSALYPPHMGGVERYTQQLARHLVARGDAVTVVTSALGTGDTGEEVDETGVTVLRLPAAMAMGGRLPLVRPGRAWQEALASLNKKPFDRVVVNTRFYPLSLVGVAFGGRRDLPTLVIDHGSGFLTLEHPLADRAVELYERTVTAWQRRWHPIYAGVSAKSAAWLATLGIQTELVVPNAIDAAAFRAEAFEPRADVPRDAEGKANDARALALGEQKAPRSELVRDFRAEMGIGPKQPVVAFAGRLLASKGATIVADAARFLPSVTFLVAGDEPSEGEGRAQGHGFAQNPVSPRTRPLRSASELQKNEDPANLRWLGALSHSELSALFLQANVLALPSLREGFATTLLEAAAWGLIPVTTPVGGSDEVLADPSWGVVLDRRTPLALAQGIDEVLSWPAAVRQARSAALAEHVATACSWQTTVSALDKAFTRGQRSR